MTLRYLDGFDYLPDGTTHTVRLLNAAGYYQYDGFLAATPIVEAGRFGFGKGLHHTGSTGTGAGGFGWVRPIGPETGLTAVAGRFGFALKVGSGHNHPSQWIGFFDAVTNAAQVTASIQANGVVRVYRGLPSGGVVLGESWAGAVYYGEDMYVELGATIADVGGAFEVRINTRPVIQLVDLDTKATAHAYFDAIGWGAEDTGGGGVNYDFKLDDLYLLDTLGAVNNEFLGNVRVKTQFPAGPGDVSDFTPTGAATNWQAALNTVLDDTKYNAAPNIGDQDLYAMEAVLGSSQVVHGAQLRSGMRQTDATQRNGHQVLKVGGVEAEGDDHFLNQTFTYYTDIVELSPDTGLGMVGSELNAAQAGPKVVAA